ncbi:MAG: glucans biosynthesis glucosyltransferase MdoH [Pseudolabrys sp.]|jgi:membrane glycosyltransferase
MNGDDVGTQRWLVLGLTLSTTAVATARLLEIFRVDGVSVLEVLILAVFALLFSWIAVSFWIACLGAHALWRGSIELPLHMPPEPSQTGEGRSRTVLAVPVYNEDCVEVFARLRAMVASLKAAGALDRFDFFVLSDSTDADCRADEAANCRALGRDEPTARVFYRHRADNTGHKSGNIAEFCRKWGGLYDYMVVLDADSLMTGETLVRLAALMDANPRTALIQVAPMLVGGESFFARSQQFASWVYGRLFAAGLAKLQGADGNYWGHNAIIRVQAFAQHCGLPKLPGRAPFGGEIMSHDFVEAALLRRAGWDVWLAPALDGSYEATPPTLIDHLKRDRRWCQGNLQHTALLFARDLRLPSRLHLGFGIMSYLSSPLWLLLILLFSANAMDTMDAAPVTYIGRYPVLSWPISHTVALVSIGVATAALLYIPKLLALLLMLREREARQRYGGANRLILGVLVENVMSTVIAPIFMLSHSWFVANILLGRKISWGAQPRGGDGIPLGRALSAFAPHSVIGLAAGLAVWRWMPSVFWWYLPLLIGPALAGLLAWATSKARWGNRARRSGLFLVPSETAGVPIVDRLDALLAAGGAGAREDDETVASEGRAVGIA